MKKIEFKPPPELRSQVGESVKAGQEMELMGTFRVKPNGDWCLVQIEGVPMPGYEEEAAPGKSDYVESAMANMPEGYGGA